ncbi:MAG TPA: DUF3592 domain-containing protein [Candidatus Aquabacterium excrementipullorum]|nr:DUF3592 domain-containing protein [Candidatus Aquabacterium excrementipullorum]
MHKTIRLIQIIFSLAGAVLLTLALYLGLDTQRFIDKAISTDGTVIDLVPNPSNDGSTTYRTEVAYIDGRGTTRTFQSSVSSNPPSHNVGEHVTVLYGAGQDASPRIQSFTHLWLGTTIAGVLGTVFLAIGGGMALYRQRQRRVAMRLRAQGQAIEARIQGVEPNEAVSVNGRHPFVVLCQWQNPTTQEVHVFRSENLWFDPSDYLKRPQVRVFIEPENPKRYLVDLSFLPKMAA